MKKLYIQLSTHWDREWYVPFQHFRYELVKVADEIINSLENESIEKFVFDGQSIVVEDYLEIVPQQAEKIKQLTKNGKLKLAPWYVMPDELLVSGESLIKNFLFGNKICNKYDTEPFRYGYVNDMFGHIAQFPQILSKFGIDMAYLGRGLGAESQDFCHFIWKSPDGSECIAYKRTYNESYLAYKNFVLSQEHSEDEKNSFIKALINKEFEAAECDVVLLNLTGDHAHMDDLMFDLYTRVITVAKAEGIKVFENGFDCALEEISKENLPDVTGELITTGEKKALRVVTDSISSYYILKQENDICQRLLENTVSPLMVYSRLIGKPVKPGFLDAAYNELLKNQPHDSICGCSAEQVHKDMIYRYDQVKQISSVIEKDFCLEMRDGEAEGDKYILSVFNPAPFERKQIITVDLDFKKNYNHIYAGNAPYQPRNMFKIYDADNEEIQYQIIEVKRNLTDIQGVILKKETLIDRYTVCFETKLNAFEKTEFSVVPTEEIIRSKNVMKSGDSWVENDYARLEIEKDGTFSLYDKLTRKTYTNLHYFIDDADAGNGWFYEDAENKASAVTSRHIDCVVEKINSGNVLTSFRITKQLPVPKSMDYDTFGRNDEKVILEIISTITLKVDSGKVYIETEINNNAKDHRVRLMLPTNVSGRKYTASQAFYFAKRNKGRNEETLSWVEPEPVEKHFNGIIYKTDEEGRGIAFVGGEGFHQAGVLDDEENTISVVMFRSFGRNYLQNNMETSQLQGKLKFRYSIIPLNADISEVELANSSIYDFRKETAAFYASKQTVRKFDNKIEVSGDNVALSIIKPAEDNLNAFVIRLFNTGDKETCAKLSLQTACNIYEVNLYEIKENVICDSVNQTDIYLKPFEIKTLLLEKLLFNQIYKQNE